MRTRYLLGGLVAALACASSPNAKHGSSSLWPGGSEPQLRMVTGVKYGQQGKITVMTGAPLYAVLLELRPTLDSLDVRRATNTAVEFPLERASDLYTSMETVDAVQGSTVSMAATNCTTVHMGAGDPTGTQVCPVSRSYGSSSGRPWRFRNRVFLLVSDKPFPTLPLAIRWSARSTAAPVAPGARWTALEL